MATLMEASMFIMFNMHACVCKFMHACACLHGVTPYTDTNPYPNTSTPTPIHPPLPQSTCLSLGTPRISKNSITLEPIKIFQFCLKI